jgi:putative hydrolases of HD superfamily
MKNILNFLIEVQRLKETPRTGWIWLEVKNPEKIADHVFGVTILSWLLGRKKNLNLKRAIKTALFHELCEVYAGDITPYFGLLPKNKIKRKEILKRWIRLPKKEKEKRAKAKFELEKKALLKLIKNLDPLIKNEIYSLWLDFEKGTSREGKFVKPIDKIETMIQAIQYFGTGKNTPVIGWWEEVEELVEDPLLIKFLKAIEKKLYRKKIKENLKELENLLDFFIKIGKLKRMPRRGWVLRDVKNPETMASHIFVVTLAGWLLSKKLNSKLNEEKLLKMSLSHAICEVYAGDITPYETILHQGKKIFNKWIRFSKKEKEKLFLKDYKQEKRALQKLIKNLPADLKEEIFMLWDEFKKNQTKEARFLNQVDVLVTLLQALFYWQRNKNFPIQPWWEWSFERIEDPLCLEFLAIMKKKFTD